MASSARAIGVPARYRLRLRHPDGREELGGFRRFRPDAPGLGHSFTTLEHGEPVSWEVAEQQLERDDEGEPYLELVGLDHIDPAMPAGGLSVAQQQLVEIARLLSRDARILILDEPTSALSDVEISKVVSVVRKLAM